MSDLTAPEVSLDELERIISVLDRVEKTIYHLQKDVLKSVNIKFIDITPEMISRYEALYKINNQINNMIEGIGEMADNIYFELSLFRNQINHHSTIESFKKIIDGLDEDSKLTLTNAISNFSVRQLKNYILKREDK